jgi:hypothetical protein
VRRKDYGEAVSLVVSAERNNSVEVSLPISAVPANNTSPCENMGKT